MKNHIKNYKELKIWQTGMGLVKEIYKMTRDFPKEELFCLVTQMRRSAISIPSNTAEGFARKHYKEFRQFLNIVLGSCAELETQIQIACELGYIVKKEELELMEKIDYIGKMTTNMMKQLQSRAHELREHESTSQRVNESTNQLEYEPTS